MIKVTVEIYNSFNDEYYGRRTFFMNLSTDKFIENINLTYGEKIHKDKIDVKHETYFRIKKDDYIIINIELEEIKPSFFSNLVNNLGIFEECDEL